MTNTRIAQPKPVDQERNFQIEELFFSITDPKGKITFANDVFLRLSGWDEKDLIGSPHNIIRHPDMPRAVFYVMWDYLNAGKPFAGYVKNMANDGAYYWVMALIFPYEDGFFSIRLKPSSPYFKKIRAHYSEILAYENEESAKNGDKQGMMAAVELFLRRVKEDGYDDYDHFMWKALEKEMRHREDELRRKGFRRKYRNGAVSEQIRAFDTHLTDLFDRLKSLKELHEKLLEHSRYILQLSRTIRLLSLNAQVGSAQMDGDGASLSAVAGQMGDQSKDGEMMLADMQKHVTALSKLLDKVNFDIITAKMQVEMSTIFLDEVSEKGENFYRSDIPVTEVVNYLQQAYVPKLIVIGDEVGQIPSSLRELRARVYEIERFLYVLRFIHSAGQIEVARLQDASSFANTFQELIREVNNADEKLKELTTYIESNQKMNNVFMESERVLSSAKKLNGNGGAKSQSGHKLPSEQAKGFDNKQSRGEGDDKSKQGASVSELDSAMS